MAQGECKREADRKPGKEGKLFYSFMLVALVLFIFTLKNVVAAGPAEREF